MSIEGQTCSYVDNSFMRLQFNGPLPERVFNKCLFDLLLTDDDAFLVMTIGFWLTYTEDTERIIVTEFNSTDGDCYSGHVCDIMIVNGQFR